jgi:hypothetical protein
MEAEWEKRKQHYQAYLGVQEVLHKYIVGAVDLQYLQERYNEYTGYTQHTARALIDHIRTKCKVTTTEKAKMRDQINFDWDQSQDFASYIVELEQIKRQLGRWGITIDEDTMIAMAIKQVNKCTLFTKKHKKTLEDVDNEERDWDLLAHTPWWCLPNYKVGPRKKEGKEAEKRVKKKGEKRRERLLHTCFVLYCV